MEITTFYRGRHPSEIPFYSQRDVADAIGVPLSTLRGWLSPLLGASRREAFKEPLLTPPDGPQGRLSFVNLTEAYVIAELRRKAKVDAGAIRRAVWFLRHKLGISRPLLSEGLLAGTEVYLEAAAGLINASKGGQFVIERVVRGYLTRVEVDSSGLPRQLYPWVLNTESKSVLIDPRIRFGQPVISGTGIMTSTVQERFEAGEEIEAIAQSYGIEVALVEDALAYELGR